MCGLSCFDLHLPDLCYRPLKQISISLFAMKKNFLLHFILLTFFSSGQTREIDSLKLKSKELGLIDSLRINCYTLLANRLLDNLEIEQCKVYADTALKLSEKINYRTGKLNSMNILAAYYKEKGDFQRSISTYKEFIRLCTIHNISKGIMFGNNNLGLTYFDSGNFKDALKSFLAALEIAKKMGSKKNEAMYYSNIALVYDSYNDYAKATEYVEKAIEIEKASGERPESVLIRYINLGSYYMNWKKPEKAITVLNEALRYNNATIKHTIYEAYLRNNLGQSYFLLDKCSLAIVEFLKAKKTFSTIDDVKVFAKLNINIANAYSKIGQKEKALQNLNEGLQAEKDVNEPEFKRYAYDAASMIYKNAGDYKNALLYANRSAAIKDSLIDKDKINALVEMQTRYETKQKQDSLLLKQMELADQKKISNQAEANSKQKTLLLFISLFGFFIMSGLTVIAFKNYKKKKQAVHILESQKTIIEQKVSENELLMSEIHHRVKNNLQIVSSLLKLPQKQITSESAKEVMLESRNRVQSVAIIHKLLYENNTTKINAGKYFEELGEIVVRSFSDNEKKIELKILPINGSLDVDHSVPIGLIINELLVNSIKHAFKDVDAPYITIDLKIEPWQIILLYNDNGSKDVSEELKLADASFGLKMIVALTEQLNGTMKTFYANGMNFMFNFIIKEPHNEN